MTLKTEEFIRRFLLHVLPSGFKRIRFYGLLNNRYKKVNLKLARQLLSGENEPVNVESQILSDNAGIESEHITAESKEWRCPRCKSLNIRIEGIPVGGYADKGNSS